MDKLRSIFVTMWNKIESLSPLVPLMLASLLLALLLVGGNDAAGALSLFQSSPPEPAPREEPTATLPPPTAPPEPTVTPAPTETPVPPTEPAATSLPPEATAVAPAETPEAPSEDSPSAPAETPAPTAEAPDEAPEAADPTPATMEEPAERAEEAPLVLNWGVFLNTVIITLSYVWICCGVFGLLGTPLAFILLYVGGKRRLIQKLEESEEDAGQN